MQDLPAAIDEADAAIDAGRYSDYGEDAAYL